MIQDLLAGMVAPVVSPSASLVSLSDAVTNSPADPWWGGFWYAFALCFIGIACFVAGRYVRFPRRVIRKPSFYERLERPGAQLPREEQRWP